MQKTHKRILSLLLLAISIFCFLMVGTQTAFAATTKTGLQVGAKDLYTVSEPVYYLNGKTTTLNGVALTSSIVTLPVTILE